MVLRRWQPTRGGSPKGKKEGVDAEETQRKWGLVGEKKGIVSPALILDRDWHEYRIHRLLYVHRDAEILRQKQKVYHIRMRIWVWYGRPTFIPAEKGRRASGSRGGPEEMKRGTYKWKLGAVDCVGGRRGDRREATEVEGADRTPRGRIG